MGAQGSGRRKDMVNMFKTAEISLQPSHAAPIYEDYGEHKVVRGKEFVVDSIVFTDGTRQTTSGGTTITIPLSVASGGTGRTDATTALVIPLAIASGGTGRTDATTALVVPLAVASGGTGQTTATAAFDALAPTTTQGDVIYFNGTDNVRLGVGTSGNVLTTQGASANPIWNTMSHTSLSDIGTNTHAQIDTHIAGTGTAVHGDSYLLNTGDTATGNYTFDTNTLFIDATGNKIGIGTITPDEQLSIVEADGGRFIVSNAAGASRKVILIQAPSVANNYGRVLAHNYGTGVGVPLILNDSAGNVGINELIPDEKLHITDATAARIKLERTSAPQSFMIGTDTSPAGLYLPHDVTAGVTRMFVSDAGNVGIGTTSPGSLLHVSGGTIQIQNTTAPATPSLSGRMFVSGGELWYIGSSGTQTKLANA